MTANVDAIVSGSEDQPQRQLPLDAALSHWTAEATRTLTVVIRGNADEALRQLAGPLQLHPLAIEDASSPNERTKADFYDHSTYLNLYLPSAASATELGIFVSTRAVVVVLKGAVAARGEHRAESALVADARRGGAVGDQVHRLLDRIVDLVLDEALRLGAAAVALEDTLPDARRRALLHQQAFQLRKQVDALSAIVEPTAGIIQALSRDHADSVGITLALRPYFDDVEDHALHSAQAVRAASQRILLVIQLNLSEQGNDMSRTMKSLAGWAAVIAVPTLVTGFYGQNVSFPGAQTLWGFVCSCVVGTGAAFTLWILLRRARWI